MRLATMTALALTGSMLPAMADTVVRIATVNNPDMVVMEKLSTAFEKLHPDIKLKWNTLGEGELNARVATDVTTGGSSFDVVAIGPFEVQNWAKNGWLTSLSDELKLHPDVAKAYDVDDVIPSVRKALSMDGSLYASPFYAEASMTFYRKDLFEKAGIAMPDRPTWPQIKEFASKINDPAHGVYGICLRGQPIWTGALITLNLVANSFGARWFDMKWKAQFDQPEWKNALTYYVDLSKFGPPGVTGNNYTENLNMFAQGKCGMWIDATVAAGYLANPAKSVVADKTGFAQSPTGPVSAKGAIAFHSWALAIPKTSKIPDAAFEFVAWATSKNYESLVASSEGTWTAVPPGTRTSLYSNPDYTKAAAAFSAPVFAAIQAADPQDANSKPVPYKGVIYMWFPEYPGLATEVGQYFSGALAGQTSVDEALKSAQIAADKMAKDAGYAE